MCAKVARFYSWTHNDISELAYIDLLTYYKAIDNIEAQEMFIKMQISDYPQMKANSRSKMHRKLSQMANPIKFEEKVVTSEEMAKMLGASL